MSVKNIITKHYVPVIAFLIVAVIMVIFTLAAANKENLLEEQRQSHTKAESKKVINTTEEIITANITEMLTYLEADPHIIEENKIEIPKWEHDLEVGVDIDPGEYVFEELPDATLCGNVKIWGTRSHHFESILYSDLFNNRTILTLEKGQFVEIYDCTITKKLSDSKLIKQLDEIQPGMYKVGLEIPSGKYELKCIYDEKELYSLYTGTHIGKARDDEFIGHFELFYGESIVLDLKDGQYITFHDSIMKKND